MGKRSVPQVLHAIHQLRQKQFTSADVSAITKMSNRQICQLLKQVAVIVEPQQMKYRYKQAVWELLPEFVQ